MTGKPVFAASEREKVLFPDPAIPVTSTRRPIAEAASSIDFSVGRNDMDSRTIEVVGAGQASDLVQRVLGVRYERADKMAGRDSPRVSVHFPCK
jgi:hypothetical protein